MLDDILFDDWKLRHENAFKNRKREYIVVSILLGILLFLSIAALFFEFYLLILLPIVLISILSGWLEWLKIKNNHLIIQNNQIEITDKFNKTRVYEINIKELVIELKHSYNRSGGIIMKFYDSQHNLICKYEDMLNHAAFLGFEKTNWEIALKALGVPIIDNEEIIKNN